jgi:hypothetical protein
MPSFRATVMVYSCAQRFVLGQFVGKSIRKEW